MNVNLLYRGMMTLKKIPTLFKREFYSKDSFKLLNEVTEGMEWVLQYSGKATIKYDGSCCCFINQEFYKRYDAKNGKPIPDGAIPCCDADPITWHHPHWVKVSETAPEDKWFISARDRYLDEGHDVYDVDWTYEAIGKHFNNNPYNLDFDILVPHGEDILSGFQRTYDGIKEFLERNYIEGIVFWKDNTPQCKIRRHDYGLEWGNKN